MAEFNPDTHKVVSKKRRKWELAIGCLLVVSVAVGAYIYRGQTLYYDGNPIVTVPDFSQTVVFKKPDGQMVEVQAPVPARALPNNPPETAVTDGFGPDHTIQRTKVITERYDPIQRTDDKVDRMADGVTKLAQMVSTGFKGLDASVKDVNARVTDLSTSTDARFKQLESAQAATSQPAPVPAPQTNAPSNVPGPTSQAAPVQSPPEQLAQGGPKVILDMHDMPAGWRVEGIDRGNAANSCTAAMGMKLVTSSKWEWKNGRKFFPNKCVPISDSRPTL